MLCDISNGTMNVMYINECRPLVKKCFTEKYGTNQCMFAVRENLMKQFGVSVDETVLIYLRYLFEQIPLRRAGGDKDFMADMVPWSEAYRAYEDKKQLQRQSLYGQLFPEPERPRAPRKEIRAWESHGAMD